MSDSDDPDDGWEEEYSINKSSIKKRRKPIKKDDRKIYLGRIFPGGNWRDEIVLFTYLITKNIKFNVYADGKNGSAFLMKRKELEKLPKWEGEEYLPTSDRGDAGFALHKFSKNDLRSLGLYDID